MSERYVIKVTQDHHMGCPQEEWDTLFKVHNTYNSRSSIPYADMPGCEYVLPQDDTYDFGDWGVQEWEEGEECGFEPEADVHTKTWQGRDGSPIGPHHQYQSEAKFPVRISDNEIYLTDDWEEATGFLTVRDEDWWNEAEPQARREVAVAELKTTSHWMRGEIYVFTISRYIECEHCGSETEDSKFEQESYWIGGFYGDDDLTEGIKQRLEELGIKEEPDTVYV